MKTRKLFPVALAVAACGSVSGSDAGDSGYDAGPIIVPDAGPCPHPNSGDAGTVRCMCEANMDYPGGPITYDECCDYDVGNPCPICCLNPREADGGRKYDPSTQMPVCYC